MAVRRALSFVDLRQVPLSSSQRQWINTSGGSSADHGTLRCLPTLPFTTVTPTKPKPRAYRSSHALVVAGEKRDANACIVFLDDVTPARSTSASMRLASSMTHCGDQTPRRSLRQSRLQSDYLGRLGHYARATSPLIPLRRKMIASPSMKSCPADCPSTAGISMPATWASPASSMKAAMM